MELTTLTAVSPIDGRYHQKTANLSAYLSEFALMKYRVRVEIEYFISLCELPLPQLEDFNRELFPTLRGLYEDFTEEDAKRIKEIESITNHDVKAIEYFIKEQLDRIGNMEAYKEFIHFGLTSQDINNTSFPMMLKEALKDVYVPLLDELIDKLNEFAEEWKDIPMLARTHGQPASPTTLGKEFKVFSYRLEQQRESVCNFAIEDISGKFGGATGNFNAHHIAYPTIDWPSFANNFLEQHLGIRREQYTTQISNYDNLAGIFDALKRIQTIIIDLDRDIWQYISLGYFKQKIKVGAQHFGRPRRVDHEVRSIPTLNCLNP